MLNVWLPAVVQEKMLQKNADAALIFRQQNQRRSAEMEQQILHHNQIHHVHMMGDDQNTSASERARLPVPEIQVSGTAGCQQPDVLPDDQSHQVISFLLILLF